MTAKELIEHLSTLDPETRIFVQGYEGGYEDAQFSGMVADMNLNVNSDWYYGPHEIANENLRGSNYETVKGVIL